MVLILPLVLVGIGAHHNLQLVSSTVDRCHFNVEAGFDWIIDETPSNKYSDQLVAIAVVAAFSIGDSVTATLVPLVLDLDAI